MSTACRKPDRPHALYIHNRPTAFAVGRLPFYILPCLTQEVFCPTQISSLQGHILMTKSCQCSLCRSATVSTVSNWFGKIDLVSKPSKNTGNLKCTAFKIRPSSCSSSKISTFSKIEFINSFFSASVNSS